MLELNCLRDQCWLGKRWHQSQICSLSITLNNVECMPFTHNIILSYTRNNIHHQGIFVHVDRASGNAMASTFQFDTKIPSQVVAHPYGPPSQPNDSISQPTTQRGPLQTDADQKRLFPIGLWVNRLLPESRPPCFSLGHAYIDFWSYPFCPERVRVTNGVWIISR